MSTLRPGTTDENRFRNGAVNDEVYNAATEYVKQMTAIFEQMPGKAQRATSKFLESDMRSSDALTRLEEMFSNQDNNSKLDESKIEELVGVILGEAEVCKTTTEGIVETLLEDEQKAELYRTNLMREWLLGDQGSSSDSDGDHDDPRPPAVSLDARRISITSNEAITSGSYRVIKPRTSSESRIDEHETARRELVSVQSPLVTSASVPEKLSSGLNKSLSAEKLKKLTEVETSHGFASEFSISRKKDSGSSSSSVSGNSNIGRIEQESLERICTKGLAGCVDDRSSSGVSSPASANGIKLAMPSKSVVNLKPEKNSGSKELCEKTVVKRKGHTQSGNKKAHTKKQKRSSADYDKDKKSTIDKSHPSTPVTKETLSSVRSSSRKPTTGEKQASEETDNDKDLTPVKEKATTSKSRKATKKPKAHVKDADSHDSGTANGEEEKYCHCQRFSFGSMIACDNDDCEYEWFHFECVSLGSKPKGKWYCPDCKPQFAA